MTLSLFTTRLVVALPTCGPPIRKKTSESVVGSFGSLRPAPLSPWPVPTRSSTGEFTAPASNISSDTSIPGWSATVIGTTPFSASSVGMPTPSTIVLARFTLIVRSMS